MSLLRIRTFPVVSGRSVVPPLPEDDAEDLMQRGGPGGEIGAKFEFLREFFQVVRWIGLFPASAPITYATWPAPSCATLRALSLLANLCSCTGARSYAKQDNRLSFVAAYAL